jgi:hypothetical protein
VEPSQPPPPAWWKVPGGNRSGKRWNRGVSITAWAGAAWDTYENRVCKIDAIVGGSDASGARVPNWAGLAGGPLDTANPASYDNAADIANDSQLDWDSGTNFGSLVARSTSGKTWLVWVAVTIPTSLAVRSADSTTWGTLAQPGPHDDWWYAMGRRARAAMVAKGMKPWQLAVRFNHEMNQSNFYRVFDGQQADYAKASGRFMAAFRRGYAAAAGDQCRMIFSPARINDLGPLESFFTVNSDGTTPYDAVDVSAHPADEVNFAVGQSYAQQVQVCKDWIKGKYKSGYAPDNVDTTRSQAALARKYGIAIVNTEWSPRYDEFDSSGQETLVGCHISAAFYDAMHQHFTNYAEMLAFECLFHGNALDPDQGTPGWRDGVAKLVDLWRGDP